MTTKTFRAETIMDALQLVQEEFGPEAIVLSVREVPVGPAWQVWRTPGCEVIAANNASSIPAAEAAGVSKSAQSEMPEGVEWIEEPLPPLKGRIPVSVAQQVIRSTTAPVQSAASPRPTQPWQPPHLAPTKPVPAPAPAPVVEPPAETKTETVLEKKAETRAAQWPASPSLARHQQHLLAQGVDEQLITRIITTCSQAFSPASLTDENRVQAYLQRQLESLLKVQSKNQLEKPARIICLIGPSGSGKTTTCARLAAYYGTRGKKVAWISVDTIRAGAIAEARTFVEALDIPLQVAYTPEELTWKIEAACDADLILVDTPGYNLSSEAQMAELGSYLTQIPERSTYLLAPAPTKETDLAQNFAALKPFNLRGLILTKLDETLTIGSLYNFAWRSQLPLAFFTSGKAVLDDFTPASATRLVSFLFGGGK